MNDQNVVSQNILGYFGWKNLMVLTESGLGQHVWCSSVLMLVLNNVAGEVIVSI